MNKEKLWMLFASLNPPITDRRMRLEPESVRKLFDETWNTAYEAGAKDMEARIMEISGDGPPPVLAGTIEQFLEALGAKPYATEKANKKKTNPGGK